MKLFNLKIGLLLLFIGHFSICSADYKDELLRLSRIDLLPQFHENVITKQVSSYDTTGGNDDGFSGKYSYIRKENGNLVIAELQGPGIIQRIHYPNPTDDTIQFYFDGEKTPRIELKSIDLFSGKKYPFKRPVVGNEIGSYYCYLPIPFKKSCKIVYKGERMHFFQIQYSETTQERVTESFPEKFSIDESEALETVINLWEKCGENILNFITTSPGQLKTATKNFTIKPGEILPVFNLGTGGRILGIEITPRIRLSGGFKDLIFRANWDNEPVAAINSPLTDFFGYAFGEPSVKSLLVGVKDGLHYCYLPMPFDKKATLELEFLQNQLNTFAEIPVGITVYYSENKRLANEGKLYVEWKREINPEMGKPYQILDKGGRGHYVGTLLQAQGLESGMTLYFEGDDQCTIDGELRLHGTGSEEYFNGAWYALPDRWDQAFSLPLHGCLGYSIPLARTGGFRFFVSDKISFEKNILLTIEHGPEGNKFPADYISLAFYYCDTPPKANNLPSAELLKKVNPPKMQEYWIQLLPVKALSEGAGISNGFCKDEKSGEKINVFKLEAPDEGFAKFELEVPSEGEYKLYMSYFKGPECGRFDVNQRQVPVKKEMEGYAPEHIFIEKEYIGDLYIEEGTNTVTVMLNGNQNKETNAFLLHRIYLERSSN